MRKPAVRKVVHQIQAQWNDYFIAWNACLLLIHSTHVGIDVNTKEIIYIKKTNKQKPIESFWCGVRVRPSRHDSSCLGECVRDIFVLFNGIWNRKLLFYRNKMREAKQRLRNSNKAASKAESNKTTKHKKMWRRRNNIRSTFDGNNKMCESVYMNIHRAKHAIAKRLILTIFR